MVINVFKWRSQERELTDFQGQESPKSEGVSVFLQEFSEIFSPIPLPPSNITTKWEPTFRGDQGSLAQGVS